MCTGFSLSTTDHEGTENCPYCGELLSRHVVTENDPETLSIALRCMHLKFAAK